MLTLDYEGLQYRYGKKKKKGKKDKKLVSADYSLNSRYFNASTWKDYKDWLEEQKKDIKLKQKEKKKKQAKPKKVNKKKSEARKPTRKELYREELKHPMWVKKRNVILKRDNHKCLLCGSENNLCVHHTKYITGNKAWEYPNSLLVTLCKDCHEKVHSERNNPLNPYRDIWLPIEGFKKYEATVEGRIRDIETKKRIQWDHGDRSGEHYIDRDGNITWNEDIERQYIWITNDNSEEVRINKKELIELVKKSS